MLYTSVTQPFSTKGPNCGKLPFQKKSSKWWKMKKQQKENKGNQIFSTFFYITSTTWAVLGQESAGLRFYLPNMNQESSDQLGYSSIVDSSCLGVLLRVRLNTQLMWVDRWEKHSQNWTDTDLVWVRCKHYSWTDVYALNFRPLGCCLCVVISKIISLHNFLVFLL